MLGTNNLAYLISPSAQATLLASPSPMTKTMKPSAPQASEPASTPSWVPWVVGATIGGIVLYFAVRE